MTSRKARAEYGVRAAPVTVGRSNGSQSARAARQSQTPTYTEKDRAKAARVKVMIDRRRGIATPDWIQELAKKA